MHVLIIILKILGCMLAFLLLLLLLLLIMPICYKFELKKENAPFFAKGQVSYFFRALLFDVGYVNEILYYRLRILGKEVLSKEYKEEPEEEPKEKSEEESKEDLEAEPEKEAKAESEKEPEQESGEKPEKEAEAESEEEPKAEPDEAEAKKEEAKEDIQEQQQIHEEALKEEEKKESKKEPIKEEKKPKPSVFDKINELLNKVEELEKKKEKLRRKYEALGGEELVAKLWLAVKKLLVHILPRKIRGYMRFGLDDPAITGYITAFLAPFYPVYGRNFSLEPDFYKEIFEADCEGSGKIFIIYIIYLIIWLLLDKNVRKLIRCLWRGKKKGK